MKRIFLFILLLTVPIAVMAQNPVTVIGGVATIDASICGANAAGNSCSFKVLLSANTTVSIINPRGGQALGIFFIQNVIGGWIVTWPSYVVSPPAVSSTANVPTLVNLQYDNSGGTWSVIGGSSGGLSGTSFGTIVDAKSPTFGGSFDTKLVWDAAFTNTTNTVTCPNSDCNFTSNDLGKIVFGTNPTINIEAAGSVVVPQGFICAINSAQSINIGTTFPGCAASNSTATCTFNSPTNQGCVLVWGHDDTAALTAAWTSVINSGPCDALMLPIGIAMVQSGQFNTNPAQLGPCRNGAGNAWQGDAVFGAGQSFSNTMIIPTPNFSFSTCTGGVDGHSCFLGSASMYSTNFSIFGAGNALSGCSSTAATSVGAELDGGSALADAYAINMALTGWGSKCVNAGNAFLGLKATSTSMTGLTNIWVTGFGFTACQFDPIAGGWVSMNSGNCVGGQGDGTHPSGLNISGTGSPIGEVISWGALYGNGQGNSESAIRFTAGSTTHFISNGDLIQQQNSGTVGNALLLTIPAASPGAVAQLFGTQLLNTGTNSGGASSNFNLSSGTVYMHGIYNVCTGTACNTIATASGANVFDNCGNYTSSVGTAFTGAGNMYGSCSITGTAQVIGNIGLTSGWGTSTVTSASGDSHRERFAISVTGVPAANPVITVTFPTPYLVAPASCGIQQVGGTFSIITLPSIGAPTATTVAITFTGTPVATNTYTFDLACGP